MYVNKKKFISIVSVVLAVILCISALGILSGGFRNWDYKHWFDKNDLVLDPNGGVVSGNGEDMESGKVYPMSQNMTFKSPSKNSVSASTGVDIKATINPVTATNQAVDWTVTFINPSSTWATGKAVASFVTATPSADGSLTANIKCLAAFGEQIKITVTSRENASAKAECVIDYAKKLEETKVEFGTGATALFSQPSYVEWKLHGNIATAFGGAKTVDYVTSIGTKSDTYVTTIKAYIFFDNGNEPEFLVNKFFSITGNNFLFDENLFKYFYGENYYSNAQLFNSVIYNFRAPTDMGIMFTITSVGEFSTKETTQGFNVNRDTIPERVESATIDNGNLIF